MIFNSCQLAFSFSGSLAGLNLGSLLNRRQGFDRLGTEEGELESLSQDLSDAEYEATGETTELNT